MEGMKTISHKSNKMAPFFRFHAQFGYKIIKFVSSCMIGNLPGWACNESKISGIKVSLVMLTSLYASGSLGGDEH